MGPAAAVGQLGVHCGGHLGERGLSYNTNGLASAVALTNVQVLLPIEEPVANIQPQPQACWNLDKCLLFPGLLVSWEPLDGHSRPSDCPVHQRGQHRLGG